MKYPVEMGLGAMIYMSNLININSGIQKLVGGIHTQPAGYSHMLNGAETFLRIRLS
jgi:hypothetical protein